MVAKKHAYLIIAHHQFEQLNFLVSLLNHERNDIYIHIDAKVKDDQFWKLQADLKRICTKSGLYFSERVDVHWGDYSQIESELKLFQATVGIDEYYYYHLISGSDLPLVSQKVIHQFFDKNPGKLFLTMANKNQRAIYERVAYHYVEPQLSVRSFQSKTLKKGLRFFRKCEVRINRILKIDHYKQFDTELGYASNWVSIDKKMVDLILENTKLIYAIFSKSLLCDELFIPTLVNKYNLKEKIAYDHIMSNVPLELQGNLRYINWWDGTPYTWTDSDKDLQELKAAKKAGHLFARKFDLERYPKVKDFILSEVNSDL